MFIHYGMKLSKTDTLPNVKKTAKILRIISHPLRLQVLSALSRKSPLNVSELLVMVDMANEQSLLSHHLIKLRDNGIIESKKRGMYMYYNIVDEKICSIIDCMNNCDITYKNNLSFE